MGAIMTNKNGVCSTKDRKATLWDHIPIYNMSTCGVSGLANHHIYDGVQLYRGLSSKSQGSLFTQL